MKELVENAVEPRFEESFGLELPSKGTDRLFSVSARLKFKLSFSKKSAASPEEVFYVHLLQIR